jgi:integrase
MVDNQVENYLDPEQLDRLVEVLKTDKNRMVCLILMFLISTGARLNEALTATWKNVSVEGGVWRVDALPVEVEKVTVDSVERFGLVGAGAVDVEGQVGLPVPVARDRQALHDHHAGLVPVAQEGEDSPDRLHDLRHGFASLLVSGGRSLYEVQQILGHSDPKVTMRYAHLSARALQDAANAASVIVRKPVVVAAEPEAKAA